MKHLCDRHPRNFLRLGDPLDPLLATVLCGAPVALEIDVLDSKFLLHDTADFLDMPTMGAVVVVLVLR